MALTGLDIYKLLAKTNCKKCGYPTCLAFALALAKSETSTEACPFIDQEVKEKLFQQTLPPVKEVIFGKDSLHLGKEKVMFRHEDKFYNKTRIGFLIKEGSDPKEFLQEYRGYLLERIGEVLGPDFIMLRYQRDRDWFLHTLNFLKEETSLCVWIEEEQLLKEALKILKDKKPLIGPINKENLSVYLRLLPQFDFAGFLISKSQNVDLEVIRKLQEAKFQNFLLFIDAPLKDVIRESIFLRKLAIEEKNREMNFPAGAFFKGELLDELPYISASICKYLSVAVFEFKKKEFIWPLFILIQNIYSDPQKPLQVEAGIYSINNPDSKSPLLVTTNFSLTYFTVSSEVETSKIPAHILCVDTEGQSVLTAWASEKFTPETIYEGMKKQEIEKLLNHKKLIIPGYVANISGKLEEISNWQVLVGPREASGLPKYLRQLKESW